MQKTTRPGRDEAAEYFFTYIDKVPDGDIVELLDKQLAETMTLLRGIGEEQSRFRYAEGKWSVRDIVGHLSDTERVFAFRALWFARGLGPTLPGFDQDVAVTASAADERSWADLVEEFGVVRAGTVLLFRSMPADAWARRGVASDNPVSVRALAFMTAGHVAHHLGILRERYLRADA